MFAICYIILLMTTHLLGHSIENQVVMHHLAGPQARAYINDITNIRIGLFREYPYLYDGCAQYEAEYLETYFKSPDADILLIFDGNKLAGFSNSIPLAQEADEIKAPFIQHGCDLNEYLYIGEVMLYPKYRGQGWLHTFFNFHEHKARRLGYRYIVLMTVERPDDHPHKPKDYRLLDNMWRHFGYEKLDGFVIHLSWSQVDTQQETSNKLAVWLKEVR